MPWQERQVKVLREEFVQSALKGKKSISSLAEEYHISRKTAYKWIKRYLEAGHVEEGSRRPHHQGNKIDAATEAVILNTREQFPY